MPDRWNRAPDGIEPIVAYRAWRFMFHKGRGELLSFSAGAFGADVDWTRACHSWEVATCLANDDRWHAAPEDECTCGFYAAKTLDGLTESFGPGGVMRTPDGRVGVVVGRVELAGKVIEHDLGYRAERIRIVELIPCRSTEWVVGMIASQMNVAVAPALDDATATPEPTPTVRRLIPSGFEPEPRVWDPARVALICIASALILLVGHATSPALDWDVVVPVMVRTAIVLGLYGARRRHDVGTVLATRRGRTG